VGMPPIDRYEAFFADAPERGVRYMLSAELLNYILGTEMEQRVSRIARLPYINGPVVIYPDAAPKPFGFPAGIVIQTQPGMLYPLAAPDMGCGYLVVDTGVEIDPESLDGGRFVPALNQLSEEIGLSSPTRKRVAQSAMEAMLTGVAGVGVPKHFSVATNPAEEANSWEPSVGIIDRDFVQSTLQRSLGSAAGHFVACYVVERTFDELAPPVGRVIAVTHIGAAPIRDHLNSQAFYAKLAENAIDSKISTIQDAADGLFAVDITTRDGSAFIGTAMAARNFGYANRQLVADRVVAVIRQQFSKETVTSAVQVRHVDHVAFEAVNGGSIRSRRGLQPLIPGRQVFLTGGEHAHAYMGVPDRNSALADDLCSHGSPLRDEMGFPPSIWDDEHGIDPTSVRKWAHTMAANTRIRSERFWSDVANIEKVMSYMRRSRMVQPTARLRQVLNYKEENL
jgi:tRNA-splicing ligase RtcB